MVASGLQKVLDDAGPLPKTRYKLRTCDLKDLGRPCSKLLPPSRKAEQRGLDSALPPACGDLLPLPESPNSSPTSTPKFGMTHVSAALRHAQRTPGGVKGGCTHSGRMVPEIPVAGTGPRRRLSREYGSGE